MSNSSSRAKSKWSIRINNERAYVFFGEKRAESKPRDVAFGPLKKAEAGILNNREVLKVILYLHFKTSLVLCIYSNNQMTQLKPQPEKCQKGREYYKL